MLQLHQQKMQTPDQGTKSRRAFWTDDEVKNLADIKKMKNFQLLSGPTTSGTFQHKSIS